MDGTENQHCPEVSIDFGIRTPHPPSIRMRLIIVYILNLNGRAKA